MRKTKKRLLKKLISRERQDAPKPKAHNRSKYPKPKNKIQTNAEIAADREKYHALRLGYLK